MNPPNHDTDIAVVGAGAAGLAAAIFAAQLRPDRGVILLDGATRIGAKILVSGGSRCNVTHAQVRPTDFNAPARIVGQIIQRFDEQAVVRWFESLGVHLKQESTGKLFPTTDTARTVLGTLMRRCDQLRVPILTRHRVHEVHLTPAGFSILHHAGQITAKRVIMATGGRSLPKTGSDGQGWSIVERLGHRVTPTYAALVPLVLAESFFHRGLSGIAHQATLTTRANGKTVDRRTGDLLWTHFGISGPVVMDASRFWVIAHAQSQNPSMSIAFFPGQQFIEVDRWLSQTAGQPGGKTIMATLAQRLPQRVAKALCRYLQHLYRAAPDQAPDASPPGDFAATAMNQLSRAQRRALVHALIGLALPVVRMRGWNDAEVTAGGVPLGEILPRTMGSRKVPGLYLIGEMLDCDGRIGGFNFQWAWSTGYLAGCAAAESLDRGDS